MSDTVLIDPTFHGPPESGHGGYVSGVLAQLIDAPAAEITLLRPPPLGQPLTVRRIDGTVSLLDGEVLIAEGRSRVLQIDVPAPVTYAEAECASQGVSRCTPSPAVSLAVPSAERTRASGCSRAA